MIKKAHSYFKKVLSGGHPVKIKYSKEQWDAQYKKGNWNFLLSSPQNNVAIVSGMLNDICRELDRKLKVLDVGCGNGSLARNINIENIDYTGIDISAEALAVAKKNFPEGKFIQSSMDNPSPVNEKFDVVIFCEVLLYVDYEKTLSLFQKNLKEDGLVIVSLYDVWRTKMIWRSLRSQLEIISKVYVKNHTKDVGWTVVLAKSKISKHVKN